MSDNNEPNSTLENDEDIKTDCPETDPADEVSNDSEETTCKGCGSPSVLEGYSIPLCRECREKYTNYPVPTGIKVFSAVVIAILIFSMISFPKSLNAGIAFERGQRAEAVKKFATAAKEYKKVVDIFPNSFIAGGKLFIAYVKNQQFEKAEEAFAMIEGKQSKDSDEIKIIDQANEAIATLDEYYNINPELINIIQAKETTPLSELAAKLNEYTIKNPNDYFGFYYYGDTLFEQEKYEESKTAYIKASTLNPDIYFLRLGTAAAYRQTGEFDKAIAECNAVLDKNAECADAYVALSKIELKRHQYKDALDNATKAYNINIENYNAVSALVLAYHFNGMTAERDAQLAILKNADGTYYDYANKIITGNLKLFD